MKSWQKVLVPSSYSVRKVIEIIDAGAMQIAIVVDKNNKLMGTITDGDIRRGILRGLSLEESVEKIMNANPVVAKNNESSQVILQLMKHKGIHHIPVIDENGCVISIETLDEVVQPEMLDNPVVLMAGGLGSRLRPLTNDYPKPLLKVGSKPILEIILQNFIEFGFRNFYISVNYKAEMIEEYFGNGSALGVNINYLREDKRLGTAGAVSMLPANLAKPVIVMNGDLLTKVNFNHLLNFHNKHQANLTLCIRDYHLQVPYGVVTLNNHRLINIEEKPVHQFFVSAGVYVLEPSTINLIPKNTYFEMPDLLKKLIATKKEVAAFPIREYWLDVGKMEDFKRAEQDFSVEFL